MFVGIDYHKRYSVATVMDEKGNIANRARITNDPASLTGFVDALPRGSKIALEATGGWYYFYELLEAKDPDIILSHPLKTKAIASAKIKNDKIDSKTLANLLRTDLLPRSYIPPREVRDNREILRYRAGLVHMRTIVKNRTHAVLGKNGVTAEFSDIFGKKAKEFLKEIQLRDCYRMSLDGFLTLDETLTALIKESDAEIECITKNDPQATLLTTIPGVAYYSALLITSEIGDIHRFPEAKKLCSYAGLVPCEHSSGGKTRRGPITKQGSKWLRWILIEESHHFKNGSKKMEKLYNRICLRHGKNKARVAVAREMLKVIFYMLRDGKPFAAPSE